LAVKPLSPREHAGGGWERAELLAAYTERHPIPVLAAALGAE